MPNKYIATRLEVASVIGITARELDLISVGLKITTPAKKKDSYSFLELQQIRKAPKVQALLKARKSISDDKAFVS